MEHNAIYLPETTIIDNINLCNEYLTLLCYNICNDTKEPFMQFMFKKIPQNPIIKEQFTLPYIFIDNNYDNNYVKNLVIDYIKNALNISGIKYTNELIENSYKGIICINNVYFALINISEIDIFYMKFSRNSEYWFLLASEIINTKSVCNIPIEDIATELFCKYSSKIAILWNSDVNQSYSLPEAVYSGGELKEVEFNAIFGQRVRPLLNDKYYSFFVNFLDAIESSGWSSNGITHNDAGRLIVENEYGKYINNGINRYAIFVNDFIEENENTDIMEVNQIKYVNINNKKMIITKFYENFKSLSYHKLNKTLLGDKYDETKKNEYMIL